MVGGSEARRPSLRALWRGLAVVGLLAGGFLGFGAGSASAQTAPCILVLCSPTPLPTVQLTPLPTLSTTLPPLPTLSLTSPSASLALPTATLPDLLPGATQSPSPTPPDSGGVLGGIVTSSQSPNPDCTVTLQGICVLPSSSPPSPGCVLSDPTCVLPGGGGSPGCTSNCTPGGGGPGSGPRDLSGGSGGRTPQATGTFSVFGGGSLSGGGTAAGGGGAAIPLGLSVATVPAVEQLSPVSGLQFGHALILWPLFGLLDVLGLAAVYLVVRRFRVRSD